MVDIADDRLAVRVPNAADDASNFVLGELCVAHPARMLCHEVQMVLPAPCSDAVL
jgi:hypothetical protein